MMRKMLVGTCAALALMLSGCTIMDGIAGKNGMDSQTQSTADNSAETNAQTDAAGDSAGADSADDADANADGTDAEASKTGAEGEADADAEASKTGAEGEADADAEASKTGAEDAASADTENALAEGTDAEGTAAASSDAASTDAASAEAAEEEVVVDAGTLAEQAENPGALIRIDGKKYKYNTNLKNYLLLGIDIWSSFDDSYEIGDAGQADSIYVVSIDKSTGEGKILTIHRNTMVDVNHYDENGQITETDNEQICMQYAYTTGNDASCRAMEDTVSTLLFNLPIDGYITLSGGGIESLTDVLGGVDVRISADYSDMDERFTEGTTLHMDGETALSYIHYRDTDEYDSATDRMNRQLDFISGVLVNFSEKSGSDLYDIFQEFGGDYILTSLNAEEIKALTDYTYDVDNTLVIPGEMQPAEPYEEYIVDEEALQELVLQNFYVEQQ